MSILTKTANDLDAARITLAEVQRDLFDVTAQASALLALLKLRDDESAHDERGLYEQRMARMVAEGVEMLACALSYTTAEVLSAALSELRAGEGVKP